jgi:hypothetical protein
VSPARTAGRVWATRAAIAVVAGLAVGIGSGLLGLSLLVGDAPPPVVREVEPEPLTPAPRRQMSGPRADGMRAGTSDQNLVGSGTLAMRDSLAVVPDLVGRVEGDARRLLERAGFTIGEIMFREDDMPVGTVLQTFPVPGERVALPATVNLILADRRRFIDFDTTGIDTLYSLPDTLRDASSPDSMRALPDTLVRLP